MPKQLKLTNYLIVGGNAVSAFLSWRLQATNACDVTLVWKSGFEAVSQYGISFRSKLFGNERFKPRHVVRTPEDAAGRKAAFDYVLLCVKALPDVYDLAAVIESVVTPQHTCILVNTTHTLGVETPLEQRFPTNVVLSLVSGAEITQLGASEFEHLGATDVWVGPANKNDAIPVAIQNDMAEALAMTLSTGQVDAKVAPNIRQQQYERMIGPIAFHPSSVLFEVPEHAELIEKVGVRSMISDVIDELLQIATSQGCRFEPDFKEKTIENLTRPTDAHSIMFQDFAAKRPMEVETYLGSPIKIAQESGIRVPRIETLYALLHHCNIVNQQKPPPSPNASAGAPGPTPPPRVASAAPRPPTNGGMGGPSMGGPSMGGPPNGNGMNGGSMRGGRNGSMGGPPMRRAPPSVNGYPSRQSNGYNPRGLPPNQMSRRPSFENNDLEEFQHLVLYDDIPEGSATAPNPADLALRERELALRQRELQLREQEYNMRRGGGRPPPPPRSHVGGFDEDDDDDDFFDPMSARGPPPPQIDTDNFDMMSVTSRKTRKAPSLSQMRRDPEASGRGMRPSSSWRPGGNQHRASAQMMANMPSTHDNLLENPLMGYSSNRYGNVDRKLMHDDSRANSLTASRLNELQGPGINAGMNGAYPTPRRTSQSPGNPFSPGGRPMGRPSPPYDGYMGRGGMANGGPPPNGMMRQPVPRHPPGQGNAVAPYQVEQHAGVSNLYPPKGPPQKQVRSLTGSASASAGSGDSAHIDSEPSAHSSQSSLGPRQAAAVAMAAAQGRTVGVQ
ncbi:MAG: hypothetical protein LQ352_006075 [Teloschistes flavicans]|nr:MAG: hypothetical protein LQ352_006075 [Teloschistes flavicans]